MPELGTWADWAQVISVPLGIIAIVIAVWQYLRGRQRRALTCEFEPVIAPIEIKAGEALGGELEILYRKKPVKNLFLVRAKLKNCGNQPIRKANVIEPVTFTAASTSRLLRTPRVLSSKPENLRLQWREGGTSKSSMPNVAVLNFELLNPGDEAIIEFLGCGGGGTLHVAARIEGVSRVEMLKPGEVDYRRGVNRAVRRICVWVTLAVVWALVLWLSPAQWSVPREFVLVNQFSGEPFVVGFVPLLVCVAAVELVALALRAAWHRQATRVE